MIVLFEFGVEVEDAVVDGQDLLLLLLGDYGRLGLGLGHLGREDFLAQVDPVTVSC